MSNKKYADISNGTIEIKDNRCPKCNTVMLSNSYKSLYVTDYEYGRELDDIPLSTVYVYVCPKCYTTYACEL